MFLRSGWVSSGTQRELLNEVLWRIFRPHSFEQNPSAESGFYHVLCANRNFRRCKPVLAACIADCPDYSDLHHFKWQRCVWCECPKNELGDYAPPDKEYPQRDHNLYRTLSNANTKEADAELSSHHVHQRFNLF